MSGHFFDFALLNLEPLTSCLSTVASVSVSVGFVAVEEVKFVLKVEVKFVVVKFVENLCASSKISTGDTITESP